MNKINKKIKISKLILAISNKNQVDLLNFFFRVSQDSIVVYANMIGDGFLFFF